MKTCKLILLFFLFQTAYGQVTISEEPSWVAKESYNTNPDMSEDDISGGAQFLLYTKQVNVDLEEVYYKSVGKAVTHNGIQNISSVSAEYDPTYQKLRFHSVDVVRDGKIINRLNMRDIQTARRETNTENFIYDGTLTAFLNIPDVRVGDITVFSYSVKGFNPIQRDKFTSSFILNTSTYVDKISAHVFSSRELKYQLKNAEVETKEQKRNGITHYAWSSEKVPAMVMDENIPYWYIQNATVFVSEYESWNEVIQWGHRLFTFNEPSGTELNAIVNDIMDKHSTESSRIMAALRFVQNEVRYLALNSGIGGYQPNAPNKVVEQRFGDCKDKSVLLTAMLHQMNIEAYPTLVNTNLKHVVADLMPSSKVFDHCIVKVIDKNDTTLWFDPTIVDQGGSLYNVYVPDYRFGLVIDPRMSTLDTIANFQNNMVDTYSTLKIKKMGGGADLEIKTHYYEGEADYIRSILKSNSKDFIDKELLSIANQNYGRSTAKAPFTVVDDSIKNEVVMLEQYHLDSIWTNSVENSDYTNLTIVPFNITAALTMPNQLERSTPYALSYPMVRRHDIKVELPEQIRARPETYTINSDYFYYDYNSTYDASSHTLNLSFYYKSQSDYVPASDFGTFYNEMGQMDSNIGYLISANKNQNGFSLAKGSWLGTLFFYVATIGVVILVITGIVIFVVRKSS